MIRTFLTSFLVANLTTTLSTTQTSVSPALRFSPVLTCAKSLVKQNSYELVKGLLKCLKSGWYVSVDTYYVLLSLMLFCCSILVLDEMDHVAKTPQPVTALFSFARKHASERLTVGITNTRALTSSGRFTHQDIRIAPYEPLSFSTFFTLRFRPSLPKAPMSPRRSSASFFLFHHHPPVEKDRCSDGRCTCGLRTREGKR